MLNKPERTFYLGIILVLGIICLLQYACGGYRKGIVPILTSEIRRDTTWFESHEQSAHIPDPISTTPPQIQWRDRWHPVDTAAIINDYLSTRYYSDTVATKFGNVRIDDSVRENKIVSRNIATDWKFPVVTKTVAEARNQLYAGFTLHGSPVGWIEGAGLSFTWKTKRDKMYDLQAYYSLPLQRIIYEGGIKWKISFKK